MERDHVLDDLEPGRSSLGNIVKDVDIMQVARKEAFELISRDPALTEERNRMLRSEIIRRYGVRIELSRVG